MPTSRNSPGTRRDATEAFFEDLGSRGNEPLLHNASGSLQIDLTSGGSTTEHFFVTLSKGDVSVSRKAIRVDAQAQVERDLFNRMVEGRTNAMAAVLRGLITIQGDLGVLTSFVRLFPGPPTSRKSRPPTHKERAR